MINFKRGLSPTIAIWSPFRALQVWKSRKIDFQTRSWGNFLANILADILGEYFGRHGQKKSAGPGPPIGPTMPWPGNFSDTLTPHLRTPTRIWLHNPRFSSFGKKSGCRSWSWARFALIFTKNSLNCAKIFENPQNLEIILARKYWRARKMLKITPQ